MTEKQAIRFISDEQGGYRIAEHSAYEPALLITNGHPGVAAAVSPADGGYGASTQTFQWNEASDAGSYRLVIAADAEFETIVKDQSGIGQNSYSVSGLEYGSIYYWKVVAINDNGYTFSNTYRFLVPNSDTYSKPLNQPVETPFYGDEAMFDNNNPLLDIGFAFDLFGEQFTQLIAEWYGEIRFQDPNSYYYMFPFSDDYNGLELSPMTKVIYKTIGAESDPDQKFVIQYTNMGLCCDYDQLDPFGTFQIILYESTNEIQFQYPNLVGFDYGERAFGSYADIGLRGSLGSVNYSKSGNIKKVSEKQAIRFIPDGLGSYTITANAVYEPILLTLNTLPAAPTAVSPADGSLSAPNLQWSDVSGATSYRVLIATDAKFKSIVLDETVAQNNLNVSGLEEGMGYYWKVVALNDAGYTFSNTYRFALASTQSINVATSGASSITSMTATVGGHVIANGNEIISERGIAYSLNANPTINDNRRVADTTGTGDYSVIIDRLQSGATYHIRAYAVSGAVITYGQDETFKTFSSSASLNTLNLSGITLEQSVSESVYAYTASVPYSVSSTTVTATVSDAVYGNVALSLYDGADSLVLGPVNLASGQTSGQLPLKSGSNQIELVLTAEDGSNKLYSVTVTRAAPPVTPTPSSGGGGGSSTVTSKDGKLTLPVGKAGEVSLNNEIEIAIPANASKKQLELTIEKVLSTQGLLSNKEILASSVYEILKNFTENFDKPVTITISFDPSKLKSGQTVAIFYYDEVKKTWVKVEGGKISKDRISADVNHFTKFAALVVDEKTGLPVSEQSTEPTTKPATEEVKFSDIAGHWAEASIKQAVYGGIVKGYANGTFKPNATVTRAEFAVMLMNALKPQGNGAELKFTDNATIGAWAKNAVAQGVQAGIIKGGNDGSFRPNAEVTRAEMAVMIANALGKSSEANATTGFADDKDIPAWAKGSVAIAKQAGIVQGKSGNKFAPQDNATRAEAVTVLLKMLTHKNK
ncbi:S-layer homology domain-containing protein [Cohnella herbarum]|uniref:SLH domain-containing protein n=1 Tax=Cohnella herbarum TaxID=2728023 RepID=A0A7Z2VNJ0_9BACL|nr:S-layer homology domain-containing protein [Cohnella herbarum]QJD86606.1 hypothetical protein HH215_27835 [Cohnella herbarum]